MVLLQPRWEASYEGRPPVYPIGCSGVITHVERLDDGRYNIVLRGVERFRIVREDHARRYRRAQVESLMQAPLRPEDRDAIRTQRSKLEALLAPAVEKAGADPRTAAALGGRRSGQRARASISISSRSRSRRCSNTTASGRAPNRSSSCSR